MSTFQHYREEADRICPHMTEEEKDAWAKHNVDHHPGFRTDHTKGRPTMRVQVREDSLVKWLLTLIVILLFLMVAHEHGWCQARSNNLIQFQQAGTPIATVPTPVIMNFQSGCTVSTIAGGVSLVCSGGGAGSTLISTNGVSNTDQTTLNFQNTTYLTWTNPSFGNVRATLGNPPSTILGDFSTTAPTTTGQIPIYDSTVPNAAGGTGAYVPGDPKVQGLVADSSTTATNPVAIGGYDTAGTPVLHMSKFLNGTPAGTEYGLVTRNIPSGTQTISGTVTTTPPSNASTNIAQVAGTTTDTNSGVKSAGTIRVVIATDQPALTNKLLVTPDSVALPANQSVNVSQINGVTPLMGNGTTGTGSQRVTIASDNTAFSVNAIESGTWTVQPGNTANTTPWLTTDSATSATGAAPPAKAAFVGFIGSGATGGFLTGAPVGDTYKNVNISTATTTLLVTGVAGRQVRINAMHLITAAANNVALIEGTGATCGTGTAGMAGGTTAASGYNLAANGGLAFGSGLGAVMQTATAGDSVCVVTSAATQLSGGLEYTIY
jgi:hypothetical protein